MAIPMSAQQIAELQRKKTPIPTMATNQAHMNPLKPMAAPKPSIGGVVPPKMPNPVAPKAGMPQAAQVQPKGVIPNMPIGAKNLIGTPGQTAKPTNLIGTPKPSVPTPMSASQVTAKPKPSNVTANGGYMPLSNNITDVRNVDQLNQLAADKLAMERAGLQNAADTQTASLQNSAKYANQLIQDNRVLEDGNFARTNAPAAWDGSVGYRGAMLDRGRQIDDTMRAADLANAMNSVQQDLYNFDTNAAANQRGIANELLQNERGYGLDVGNQAISKGQLTGEYFDPQAQSIANQIVGLKQQAEAPGITAEQRAGLSAKANGLRGQLSNMGYDANQFGANVNSSSAQSNMSGLGQKTVGQQSQDFSERADIRDYKRGVYESDRNFNEGVRQDNRNFEYTAGRDKVADDRWEAEFNRIKDQDGIQNALAFASQTLNREQFEDSSARDWAGLDFDMANSGAEAKGTFTTNQVYSAIEQKYKDFFDGSATASPADLETMYQDVIRYGLDEAKENDVLRGIGLSKEQIAAFDKKYLSDPK